MEMANPKLVYSIIAACTFITFVLATGAYSEFFNHLKSNEIDQKKITVSTDERNNIVTLNSSEIKN